MIQNFLEGIRWDVLITLGIAILLYICLIYNRYEKNKLLKKQNKKPKEILVFMDFLYTIVTSATLYGGISAIYYSIKGKLLFDQNFIISQEYIILFSGAVLLALGILAFKKALKDILEGKE